MDQSGIMKTILVIEDDKFVRVATVDMLEAAGYVVISAEHGRTGVQLALDSHPDLIICDILMPQLDGYAVLAALQKDPATSTIPFIFVTARAEKSDLRLGMQLGADDYLVKPFTREELLGAIESRLRHHTVLAGFP
jgi:CheY-like chemotaxis protein